MNIDILYMGGNQVGCIGLLTLRSIGYNVVLAIAHDNFVGDLCRQLRIKWTNSISNPWHIPRSNSHLLVSCGGREIISDYILDTFWYGGINVHPCLYAYKGPDPVGRLLADGNTKASVGVHRMTDNIDEGEVLVEEFVDVTGCKTRDEVYNKLYPYYAIALIKAMRMIA